MLEYFRIAARTDSLTPGVSSRPRFEKARQALSDKGVRLVGIFQSDTAFTVATEDLTREQLAFMMNDVERGFWDVSKDVPPHIKARNKRESRSLYL